jgi:hypothetical protein
VGVVVLDSVDIAGYGVRVLAPCSPKIEEGHLQVKTILGAVLEQLGSWGEWLRLIGPVEEGATNMRPTALLPVV